MSAATVVSDSAPSHPSFPHRHLTGIAELSAQDIRTILSRAAFYADKEAQARLGKPVHHEPVLKDCSVLTLFFENSTRTRTSFGLAAERLGAHVTHIPIAQSSVNKGETTLDTVRTLDAMRVDALVIRHAENGVLQALLPYVKASLLNAGEGTNEHPTQALLDALTIERRFGRLEGLKIVICGDIEHSRVARSNIHLLNKMGAHPCVVAPSVFMPRDRAALNAQTFESLDDALKDADVVMMLRIQHERLAAGEFAMSLKEYHNRFGLNHARLSLAKPTAVVLHPGPVNRGVELDSALMDDLSKSLILEQVSLGVPVRMACLELLLAR